MHRGEVAVHPIQGNARPGPLAGLGGEVPDAVAGLGMQRARVQPRLTQPVRRGVEGLQLPLGIRLRLPLRTVGHAQMGEHPRHMQMGQAEHGLQLLRVLHGDAQTVHPRVHRQMHLQRHPLAGQGPAVVPVRHRLNEPPAPEQLRLFRRCPSQHQDGGEDPRLPQGDPLRHAGHRECLHPPAPKRPSHRHRPVAIGVRLHHRHQPAAAARGGLEHLGVVGQGVQVHLPPRPGGGVRAQRPQEVYRPRRQDGEGQHRQKVHQTVVQQQLLQPGQPGGGAQQHDPPGVDHIHHHGHPPGRPGLPPVQGQKQGEQEHHAHRQQQVHAVPALIVHGVEPQPLHAHPRQGGGKAQTGGKGAPPQPRRPQQKEQRRVKQSVPGLLPDQKHPVIDRGQRRDLGDQSVIAVSPQSHQV